jgi:'Cold-shock' DNA-binding domain
MATGTVKWFNDAKGFGFMRRSNVEPIVRFGGCAARPGSALHRRSNPGSSMFLNRVRKFDSCRGHTAESW